MVKSDFYVNDISAPLKCCFRHRPWICVSLSMIAKRFSLRQWHFSFSVFKLESLEMVTLHFFLFVSKVAFNVPNESQIMPNVQRHSAFFRARVLRPTNLDAISSSKQ